MVRPAMSVSLTVGGKSTAQMFIASPKPSSTKWMTNWPFFMMLIVVSLSDLSWRRVSKQRRATGGAARGAAGAGRGGAGACGAEHATGHGARVGGGAHASGGAGGQR